MSEEQPSELLAARRRKLEALREEGIEPFPHAYPGVRRSPRSRRRTTSCPTGEETEDRVRVAGRLAARRGQGKAAFLDLVDRTGRHAAARARRRARRGGARAPALARPRRPDRRRRHRLPHPPRRALAQARRLRAAGQVAAPAAREAPRADRRRDALPPPRARPDRQRGDARALHHAREGHHRDPRLARRARLRRGRDAGAAADLRRRRGAPVHDALTTRSTARSTCASPPSSTSSG